MTLMLRLGLKWAHMHTYTHRRINKTCIELTSFVDAVLTQFGFILLGQGLRALHSEYV